MLEKQVVAYGNCSNKQDGVEEKIENKFLHFFYWITVYFFARPEIYLIKRTTKTGTTIAKISVMEFMLVITLNLFLLYVI